MGKGHNRRSSSSSSSSDDERYRQMGFQGHLDKHTKKMIKKGLINPPNQPYVYPGAAGAAPHQGYPLGAQPYGAHPPPGAPGYPGQSPYGPPGTAGYGPPGAPGYGPPPPGAPGYGPPPPGVSGYGPPPPGVSSYGPPPPGAGGYGAPPPGGPGYGPSPPGAPGYGPSPPGAPGYGPPPPGASGYGPPPGAPGYGPSPPGAPGYGPPPSGAAGYGPPPSSMPGYGPPPPAAAGYGPTSGSAPPPSVAYGCGPTPQAPTCYAPQGTPSAYGPPGSCYALPRIEGTLKPAANFNAAADAERLRKAMKGIGTDEASIITVWGHRTAQQRVEITSAYQQSYGRFLREDFKSELTGNFEQLCCSMTYTMPEFEAYCLHHAMKGAGTDEDCLMELLCTRSNQQIRAFTEAFKNLYHENLEKEIMSETSGYFKRMLISLMQAHRDENPNVDMALVTQDVETLYNAGPAQWGTEESELNKVLCQRSPQHLRAVFTEYEKRHCKRLEDMLESELSGDVAKGMRTIVKCIRDPPTYFAEALHKSMKGIGTDDNKLQRIIVSRCEVDMVQIKEAYQHSFGHSLANDIHSDASGDYKKLLLALIAEGN